MRTSRKLSLGSVLAVALLTAPASGADDPAAVGTLTGKGLTRIGAVYELDVDAHLGQRLDAVRRAEADFQTFIRRRQSIEGEINHANAVLDDLGRRLTAVDAQLNAPGAKDAVGSYNELVGQHNKLVQQIEQGRTFVRQKTQDLERLPSPTSPIVVRVALANEVEAAQAQYTALAADPSVAQALATLNASGGPRIRLGPSPLFVQQLPQIRRQHEQDMKAAVEGRVEHNLLRVTTTLNDSTTVPMVVDSGASIVLITDDIAKQAEVEVKADSRPLTITTASGEQLEAKLGVIRSLSVGQFTATDVACAILPKRADGIECLLGESFLSRFMFQIDLGSAELRLTPISTNASDASDASQPAARRPAAPTSRPATSRPTRRR